MASSTMSASSTRAEPGCSTSLPPSNLHVCLSVFAEAQQAGSHVDASYLGQGNDKQHHHPKSRSTQAVQLVHMH